MSSASMACVLVGAAMMPNVSSSQTVAADFATDPTYGSGWSAGQNGGFGFGAWSFNGTDPTPAGQYQGMSSSSPLGTSWTLLTHDSGSGLANAGRAIIGGLQVGETFETVIENPSAYTVGQYQGGYRGWDILFTSGTDNNVGGDNTAALRASVFDYFDPSQHWRINDAGGGTTTPLLGGTTAAAGVRVDLTLNSATTYSLVMTPLNGATAYSKSGTYAGPITYVDFRLYNAASSGLNDTAENFEISSMAVTVPEPSSAAIFGLVSAGLIFFRRRR